MLADWPQILARRRFCGQPRAHDDTGNAEPDATEFDSKCVCRLEDWVEQSRNELPLPKRRRKREPRRSSTVERHRCDPNCCLQVWESCGMAGVDVTASRRRHTGCAPAKRCLLCGGIVSPPKTQKVGASGTIAWPRSRGCAALGTSATFRWLWLSRVPCSRLLCVLSRAAAVEIRHRGLTHGSTPMAKGFVSPTPPC
jgi:hypothetical protein